MDELIERLRAEKQILDSKVYKDGFEAGKEDAQKLSYPDFLRVEEDCLFDAAVGIDDWCSRLPEEVRDNMGYSDRVSPDVWARGWFEGVFAIWEEIKDKL